MKQLQSFAMISQRPHDNWCFAAITASVWRFYSGSNQLNMCDVVSEIMKPQRCCGSPTPPACETKRPLERALSNFGLWRSTLPPIPFDSTGSAVSVTSEIDAGRPICVAIRFSTTIHFAVIRGYAAQRLVNVDDPLFDNQQLDHGFLRTSYHDGGKWFATYLTKPPAP